MKDSFWLGCAAGFVLPVLGILLLFYTPVFVTFSEQKQIAFLFLIIGANLLILRYAYKKRKDKFSRGVLLSTSVVFFYFVFINKHFLSF